MPRVDSLARTLYDKAYRSKPEVRLRDNTNARRRYEAGGKEKKKLYDQWYSKTPEYKARRVVYMVERRKQNWGRVRLNELAHRAKKLGVPFDLKAEDIALPNVCPVLGIPLVVSAANGRGGLRMNSPSVDRIVPSKGYVTGNVIVISMRANTLKKDATIDEMRMLHEFYSKFTTKED